MIEEFKHWSDTNPKVKENLSINLGLREWDTLKKEEKDKIFLHFTNHDWFVDESSDLILKTIYQLNDKFKFYSYGKRTLQHGGPHILYTRVEACCRKEATLDFYTIFIGEKQDVVYEMLSVYAENLIDRNYSDIEDVYKIFDRFKNCFNNISEQFAINIMLTRNAFIFRQEEKISQEIYEPVLNILSDPKWGPVNRDLKDAFNDYILKTESGYSSCITHTISALEAYLQLVVEGKIGKTQLSTLISSATRRKLIPSDKFTEQIFDNIETILMYERQQTGDPHPKKAYANEKNARLIMNLVMVFLQHCLQN